MVLRTNAEGDGDPGLSTTTLLGGVKQDLKPRTRVSVANLVGGGVLWTRTPAVVEPGRGDVRVPQPLLDEGDVRLVLQSVGGCRCAERMEATALRPSRQQPRRSLFSDLVDAEPPSIALLRSPVTRFRTGRKRAPFLSSPCPSELESRHRSRMTLRGGPARSGSSIPCPGP